MSVLQNSIRLIVISGAIIIIAVSGAEYTAYAQAGKGIVDTTLNNMHIELHIEKAKPFFTKDQVEANGVKDGMLIIRGAKPLIPGADINPNRHIAIHIFDIKNAAAVTNAKVEMSLQPLDTEGNNSGRVIEVPIVVMETIGKGVQSTHYGNNVILLDGSYVALISINGKKLKFNINRNYSTSAPIQYMDIQ